MSDLEYIKYVSLPNSTKKIVAFKLCCGLALLGLQTGAHKPRVPGTGREEQLQLTHQTLSQPKTSAKPQNSLHHEAGLMQD